MRHTFESEQWLPYSVEQVFAFFANPENLPRLMPKWQKARIEEATFAPAPARPASALAVTFRGVAAGAGTKMTISFRPFPFSPVRVPWDAEIVEFAWNDHFCDVQHRGPFAYWRHCHHLAADRRDGVDGTSVRDRVEYELPLGALGELANGLVMRWQLRSIFEFRHERTAELLPLMPATRASSPASLAPHGA
jgi:ligand-binding SRPBCC domain-containing protein